MASIRQEAQDVLDVARDGIGWIVLYKNGRGWNSMTFWPDVDKHGNPFFEEFDLEGLQNILTIDPRACLLNGWWHNLGDTEHMTRDSLAEFLRWQYNLGHNLLADALQ